MIAFSRISTLQASRPQIYNAVRVAEQAGDHAAQNHLLRFLDRLAWPLAISGLVSAAAFPAAVAFVACTPLGRKPETSLMETNSLTPNRKGISR